MTDFEELENLSDQEVWDLLKSESGVGRARVLYELSRRSYSKKNYVEALTFAEESNFHYLNHKNEVTNIEIGDSYIAIAVNNQDLKNYEKAIDNSNLALKFYSQSGCNFNPLVSEMLIDAFENLDKYEEAIAELQNLAKNVEFDQNADMAYILIRIADNLKKLDKFDEAIETAKEAKKIALNKKSDNQSWYIEAFIAEVLFYKKDFDDSLKIFSRVVDVFSLFGKDMQEVKAKFFIARILKAQDKLDESYDALSSLTEEIKIKSIEDNSFIIEVEEELIQNLELLNKEANNEEIEFRKRRIQNYQEITTVKE